ncbi:reverse transcriptase domain-containing protein [Tanacetum coccineum]
MTLELADRSITKPIGITKDVRVMVGKFQFPADFVVVDFEPDPRVPLILGRSFLKTNRALIDVYEGEITLCVGKEAITFNVDQTSRYTANYNHMTANRIDVIELTSEEYSQEVLCFSDSVAYGNPYPYYDPIVSNSSPTLTPFGDSDFLLLEEANAFIAIDDEPISREIDATYYDPEGDILILEALLNSEPLPPPPNHKDYSPRIRKELKVIEAKTVKSSIDEPPEVELKDLPPHLEYAFLEGDDKFPVIIAKDWKDGKRAALIKVFKVPQASQIDWKTLRYQRVLDLEFCTLQKSYRKSDYETNSSESKRVNPKITTSSKREFDVEIRDKKGAENIAADHLSRLENPHQDEFENKQITKTFPLETLGSVALRDDNAPWFADFASYHAGNFIVKGICVSGQEALDILKACHCGPTVGGTLRKVQLNELNELCDHAYENSLIYKEKTKRIHDSKIKNRVFNVGDRVLLFNSRLKIFSGKLKTRWSGPFTVTQVFPYGTVELSQNSGPNFKVNGHRLKHYFGGDVPQLDFPDCEDSRARSFTLHPQEFHILSFILGIQYPNLID